MDRRSSGSDGTSSRSSLRQHRKSGDLVTKGDHSADWPSNGLKAVSTVAGAINSLFKRSSTSFDKELVYQSVATSERLDCWVQCACP